MIHYLCTSVSFNNSCISMLVTWRLENWVSSREILLGVQVSHRELGKYSRCSDLAMVCTVQGSDPSRCKRFCFFFEMSRPALELSHPVMLWVLRALSPGSKRLGNESDHFLHRVPRLRMSGAILHSPVCLYEVYRDIIIFTLVTAYSLFWENFLPCPLEPFMAMYKAYAFVYWKW